MKVDIPKLNDVMYHWNWCPYCKGSSLGDIMFHLDCIKNGIEIDMIPKQDREVLSKFPLMTDTLEIVRP